jgi:acyl dehydratase
MSFELGERTVSEEEIIRFAREFDPQSFHVDTELARESSFGGLIASGWHTCSICSRLLVDSLFQDTANLGGLGVDEMRWIAPVRPGDTLIGRATVLEARPSKSKPDRGPVALRVELENQDGAIVWHATCWSLIRRRP